jgi:hypothetical protein
MINTKLQNIIDTKSAIGNAIVNKGGTITSETPFFNYAAQIDGISTGGGAYSTFVAQAQDNSLYTVYNGYDAITNPTPNLSNNFAFNQWLLNNSATGDVVLSNVVVTNGGTFNGPNTALNQANMAFINNTANYGGIIFSITTNDGFLYVGGDTNRTVQKFHESNLVRVGNTVSYGAGAIQNIITNNGFIYAGGESNQTVQKFGESNLTRVGNTASYGGTIFAITANNGFIYVAGTFGAFPWLNSVVTKYNESNLSIVNNTAIFNGGWFSLATNNGFIYAGGFGNTGKLHKFHESNLVFDSNSVDTGTFVSIAINNGFIYTGRQSVSKFHESNLAFVGNTADYGGSIEKIKINDGFIYVGGDTNRTVQKFHESNLAFVGNTADYGGTITSLTMNNGFIYAGGRDIFTVHKFQEAELTPDNQTFYNITNIKE